MEKDGQNIFEVYFKDRKNVSASFEKSFKDFFTSGGEELVKIGKTDGSGNLYYSLGLSYYPQQLDNAVSAGFNVEKEIKPLGGVPSLKAGQRAEVTITVTTTQDRRFVVLQDYLPAGFEVVDFSLATEGEEKTSADDEQDKAANPYAEYFSGNPFFRQEIYDDSIAAFADYMPAGTYKFKYTVNASVQGSFKVPPAWVNAMYQPEVYGRTASGSFEIK